MAQENLDKGEKKTKNEIEVQLKNCGYLSLISQYALPQDCLINIF